MTDWPRSILPADRDGRFNWLMVAISWLYRALRSGERPVSVVLVVRSERGERTVRYPGNGAEASVELESERDEEKAC